MDSRFQQGLPSDRVIAEWWLDSPRVKRALAGKPVRNPRKKPARIIEIPAEIDRLIRENIAEARAWQVRVRELFEQCFAAKLMVTGFAHGEKSAQYLLDPYEN